MSCVHAVTALGCAAATAAKSRVETAEFVALFCSLSGSSAIVSEGEGLDWLSVLGALAGLGGAGALRIAEKLALQDLFCTAVGSDGVPPGRAGNSLLFGTRCAGVLRLA